ncbi:MAG: nucleoside 2-deoxyribosyltransferase domain-containing protein [Ilumatobacteraceae bacterium]
MEQEEGSFLDPLSGNEPEWNQLAAGREPRVFLSGGTRTPWRDPIVQAFSDVGFFDPSTLRDLSMRQIAETERRWLDESNLVLFYFEETNPSGLGSAFEMGYAIARGVPVLFVDEKRTSHTEWLGIHCTGTFNTLDAALDAMVEILGLDSSRLGDGERSM